MMTNWLMDLGIRYTVTRSDPSKGAPGSESRTGPRLVSPAAGGEKKNWNLL